MQTLATDCQKSHTASEPRRLLVRNIPTGSATLRPREPRRALRRVSGRYACLMCCVAVPAFAARPLITDDARVVDAKACQLETWVRRTPDSTEYWALPACNPTGNVEIAFGAALTRELGATRTSDVQTQVKTVFRKLEPNGWAYGLVVGHLRQPDDPRSFGANLYGYVPVSFSLADDRVVVHVNAGAARPPERSSHRPTWGVGTEIKLTEKAFLLSEVFSQTGGRPLFQAGVRYWIVPERLQVDATYGDRLGSSRGERWFSIGMRVLTPAFLP